MPDPAHRTGHPAAAAGPSAGPLADAADAAAPADVGRGGAAAPRPIRFVFRGQVQTVHDLPTRTTVLAWLREQAAATGTKEGCNEGDCGACTVLLGRRDATRPGGVALRPINSCLSLLPTLDGQALITVEDIGRPGALHPVQQALVDHHGSQCGFCTPGFVMTLTALRLGADGDAPPSRQRIADALSGNLCRCTGYRPILDAAQSLWPRPVNPPDLTATAAALDVLAADAPLHYVPGTGAAFHAPRSTAALAQLRQDRPQARLLAGGTDLALTVTKRLQDPGELIHLGAVAELQTLTEREGHLVIGAGVSLEAAWAALADRWPALRSMGLRFASWPVREAGTLVGNLANGSPIGDGAPVLMALEARLRLRCGQAERLVPLHAFYTGYQRNAMTAGEFIAAVEVPLWPDGDGSTRQPWTPPAQAAAPPPATQHLQAHKLSLRHDSDISAVAAGLWIALDAEHRVVDSRLAFGGMAATVQRARSAEASLKGQPWTRSTLAAAQAALAQDFQPLSDLRASASHRLRGAQALLQRLWLSTRADEPLPADALSVWEGR